MNEMINKTTEKDLYNRVAEEINHRWPDWKKEAYNEMFAVSAHAGKISVRK